MKKSWLILGGVLIVLVAVVFLTRHKIKSMLIGNSALQPVPSVAQIQPTQPTVPTDNIYKTAVDPKAGTYITDFNGMALYIYDKDTAGVSNCTGACITAWPYYTSGATAQKIFPVNITVIKRADGSEQFAWKGKPLYYYSKDTKAGETSGNGVGGVWHLINPSES